MRAPGTVIETPLPGGIDLFVLDGGLTEGGQEFTRSSWLRLPAGSVLRGWLLLLINPRKKSAKGPT